MKNVCIILITTIFLSGCAYFIKPKGMTHVYPGEYTGLDTLINIKGYYVATLKRYPEICYKTLMFYEDGIIAAPLYVVFNSENLILDTFVTYKTEKGNDKYCHNWGVYKIAGNTIKVKTTSYRKDLFKFETNEATFLIINQNEIKQIEGYELDQGLIYHFIPYPNRVDSTNWLLKKRWFWKKKK